MTTAATHLVRKCSFIFVTIGFPITVTTFMSTSTVCLTVITTVWSTTLLTLIRVNAVVVVGVIAAIAHLGLHRFH